MSAGQNQMVPPGLAELHVHLEGTVRWETALDLGRRHGVGLPLPYRYHDLAGFLDVYAAVNRCLRDAADFERVVLEHADRMAVDSIEYAELSFNPTLHAGDGWLPGIESGRRLAQDRFNVEIAWIVELSRAAPLAVNEQALEIAFSTEGVVGVGLVGDEAVSAAPLRSLFDSARARGLGVMPHAGQNGGPQSIWECLDVLGADRIAHGVTGVTDGELLGELARRGVCLCVAPSSNRRIGLEPDFARLAEAGVALTANTDDPSLVGTRLEQELAALSADTGRSLEDLNAAAWRHRFWPPAA